MGSFGASDIIICQMIWIDWGWNNMEEAMKYLQSESK
jgi:hypothetical protein